MRDQQEKELAESILKQCVLLTDGDTGYIYRYIDGVYKKLTTNQIEYYIISEYTDKDIIYNRQKKNITLDMLKTLTYRNSRIIEQSTLGTINLKNGVYFFDKVMGLVILDFLGNKRNSTENGTLKQAMVNFKYHPIKDYYSFNQLPVEYNPKAKCPAFDKFVGEVFGVDKVDSIYDFIGYLLMPTVKYQRALILVGEGSNGKTTFLEALITFLGMDNVGQIPLQDLSGKYALYNLKNKFANIVSDLPEKKLDDTGNAKRIVTDLYLSSMIKFIQGNFVFLNRCKMLYSCNKLPQTKDKSSAFYRRWRLYICDAEFEEKDVNMLEKLTTPEELSGLFNRAIEGIERLINNKGFPDTEKEVKELWEIESNPMAEFILKRCVKEKGVEIKSRDLFDAFNKYRSENGKSTLHYKSIGHWIRQTGVVGIHKRDKDELDNYGNSKWFTFYQDLRLKDVVLSIQKDLSLRDIIEISTGEKL